MFNTDIKDSATLFEETQKNFRKFDGIDKFFELTKELYGNDFLCWGDDQIDEIAYNSNNKKLTVRICTFGNDTTYNGKQVNHVFWVMDFFDVEILYFDISPEHWIDDVFIQENEDGKYSITFGSGELDFRYSYAKVNRCWVETE
jgi:hypothetical protein